MSNAPQLVVTCATYFFATSMVIGGAALYGVLGVAFGTVDTQPAGYGTSVEGVDDVGLTATFFFLPPPSQETSRIAITNTATAIAALRMVRLRRRFLSWAS